MISFVPSTPIGIGLCLLILALGPRRGLPVFFATMPFGATAVFSAVGVGNVVLQDCGAIAYALTAFARLRFRNVTTLLGPGGPGFPLLVLCVILGLGVAFSSQVFAGRTSVYAIQYVDGRAFINLVPFQPAQIPFGQAIRFLMGAGVFVAIATVRWQPDDWRIAVRALLAASSVHLLVSLADWVSYPLGMAYVLDPLRTINQAILVEQYFGTVRRLIGGHTEPASFGLFTMGLFGFWLRLQSGKTRFKASAFLLMAMAVLALRSTSSATIVNLLIFTTVFLLFHWQEIARRTGWAATFLCLFGAMPAVIACGVLIMDHSQNAQTLADALFFEKASSLSAQERSSWNSQALENFKASYGLGLGIGSVRASGWIFAVLGNLGLPGAIAFCWFLWRSFLSPGLGGAQGQIDKDVTAALRCGAAALLVQSILTTPYPNLGLPFFAMMGLAVGLDQSWHTISVRPGNVGRSPFAMRMRLR